MQWIEVMQFVDRFCQSVYKELPEFSNTFSICNYIRRQTFEDTKYCILVLSTKIFLSKPLFVFEGTTTRKAEVHIRDLATW